MKQKIILSIFFLMILSLSVFVSAQEYDCEESDDGLDQFKQGVVSYGGYEYIDGCASGGEVSRANNVEAVRGDVIEYSCYSEEGNKLCSGSACLFSVLKCPSEQTCKDGECVPKVQDPFSLPDGVDCEDSDSGIDYKTKGLVKYRVDDGSVNRAEDYCETDTKLREWYCEGSKRQLSVTECSEVCAGGKCIEKGDDVDFKKDYKKYCNDESCYIIEEDILLIKFISKTELREGCLVEEECLRYAGKYSFNDYPIQSYIELRANIDFFELKDVLQKKYNQEPQMADYAGSDYYLVEETGAILLFWISDEKLVSLEISKDIENYGDNDHIETFIEKYLEIHPSDVEKNLNFFERIFDWFRNLFR